MKHFLLFTALSFFSENLLAQFSGQPNALNITGPQNTLKSEIPLAKPSVTGSTYLDENWRQGEVVLKNGNITEPFPIRVEIEQANAEVQYNGEIKYLDLEMVEGIQFREAQTGRKHTIIKGARYTLDNKQLEGILVVQESGEQYSVLKHFYIELFQANYNVALDVGSKDHRKVKKEKLYLSQDSKLVLVKGSNKKIASQLGADKEKAVDLIKEHKLHLTKETDLIAFVRLMEN